MLSWEVLPPFCLWRAGTSAGAAEDGKAIAQSDRDRCWTELPEALLAPTFPVLAARCPLPSLQVCTISAFQDLLPLICSLHLPQNSG